MKTLIKEIRTRSSNKFNFLFKYLTSAISGFLYHRQYRHIKNVCLFIGYARSGHTLIGSLLDAHPNMVISMELGLHKYVSLGFKKNQIIRSAIKSSVKYTREGNIWTGYSYKVNNQWQGKFKKLEVIGDKFALIFTNALKEDPKIIDRIEKVLKVKIKFIHVIRNPFDVITTSVIRTFELQKRPYPPETSDLLPAIKLFLNKAETIDKFRGDPEHDIYHLYHEDLIKNPSKYLQGIIDFLSLETNEDYISQCASIVYKKPNKSRSKISWPDPLIEYLEGELQKYPQLAHYRYKD